MANAQTDPPMNQDTLTRTPAQQLVGLVLSFIVCFVVAGLGSLATTPQLAGWFEELIKPSWNPPNWIFGPVWSTLFAMMAVAAWLVWRTSGFQAAKTALTLFAIQLILNVGWSVCFFAMQNPGFALMEIAVLWIAIAITIKLFINHSKLAGILMTPYLAWVTFATVLNYRIWSLNH